MSQPPKYIFQQVAHQNNLVAEKLAKMASRSPFRHKPTIEFTQGYVAKENHPLNSKTVLTRYYSDGPQLNVIGVIIFLVGFILIGVAFGTTLYDLFLIHWKGISLAIGGSFIGSGLIFIFGRLDKEPLRNIDPPNSDSSEPLCELENLAKRTTSRLRTAYRIQIILICFVATLLFTIVLWSIWTVIQNQLAYTTFFGSSGIAMIILSKWKWQPFERVTEARKLADDADILTMGLRLRIKTISEITDPKERSEAQWVAVSDYLDKSKWDLLKGQE